MSFAVDKFGDTWAWGENKHNALLIEDDKKIVNADMPSRVKYPEFFIFHSNGEKRNLKNINVVNNNIGGVTIYEGKRPVKSVASET